MNGAAFWRVSSNMSIADALEISDVVRRNLSGFATIFYALRPQLLVRMGEARPASRLIDLLDEFDGLVLDGYGVINVGDVKLMVLPPCLDAAASKINRCLF